MKILWVDFETGGLDYLTHSPLSLGLLLTEGEQVIAEAEWQIREEPLVVTQKALQTNKIDLTSSGVNYDTLRNYYKKFMGDYCFAGFEEKPSYNGKTTYVEVKGFTVDKAPYFGGHNVLFDKPWLKQILRNGKSEGWDMCKYHSIDTMILAVILKDSGLLPSEMGVSLSNLATYLKIDGYDDTKAHSALNDCKTAHKVYLRLQELVKSVQK
jgi:hypothetical protein